MKRIYVREEVCMGCGLCRVHCQTEHSQSKDIYKAFKREMPLPQPRLCVERKGDVCFAVQCRHCDEPWCVYSCLTGALNRDPDSGIVTVDEERCVGCWTCVLACPFGAIKQDMSQSKIIKCDLCPMEETPACVANCPNEALVYVEVQDGSPNVERKLIAAVQ